MLELGCQDGWLFIKGIREGVNVRRCQGFQRKKSTPLEAGRQLTLHKKPFGEKSLGLKAGGVGKQSTQSRQPEKLWASRPAPQSASTHLGRASACGERPSHCRVSVLPGLGKRRLGVLGVLTFYEILLLTKNSKIPQAVPFASGCPAHSPRHESGGVIK